MSTNETLNTLSAAHTAHAEAVTTTLDAIRDHLQDTPDDGTETAIQCLVKMVDLLVCEQMRIANALEMVSTMLGSTLTYMNGPGPAAHQISVVNTVRTESGY